MGKLFEFIKEKYKSIKNFEKEYNNNPEVMANYNLYHKPAIDMEYFKEFIHKYVANTDRCAEKLAAEVDKYM